MEGQRGLTTSLRINLASYCSKKDHSEKILPSPCVADLSQLPLVAFLTVFLVQILLFHGAFPLFLLHVASASVLSPG
nr:hypothetical protein Iba_chr14aCG26170 [Ipomoea batatas]